ncbi:trypsin alpha-4 [Drosophila serrata]|uniref:trypsin alpha-4 n=1 Tax=Drosophila serrata TaxID=7274 RepID=UPI000A1D0FBC|nr:trypsin alpha-4 [Drosophila serrata]
MPLLFSFLWISLVSLLTANPDISVPQDRILGGHDTEIDEAPWQVSLQKNGIHNCGGSIYSQTIIITAAHCVHGLKTGTLSIRAGSSKHNSGGIVVKVAAFKYHERYDSVTIHNDVAVILLKDPLALSPYIQSIPLAKTDPAEGSQALSTGWGSTGLFSPIHLQGVDLKIESKSFCRLKYPFRVYKTDICAGHLGKAVCRGDSGGPLVVNGKLVGIVSRSGNILCLASGLYVSVAHYRKWILRTIESF